MRSSCPGPEDEPSSPLCSSSKMKSKILIVEDHKDTAFVLKEYFDCEGYDSDVATTGKEALRKFKARKHDVIVTDYNLPDLNGLELAKQCRRIVDDVKIIFITGADILRSNPGLKTATKCKVVQKPVRPKEILKLVLGM